MSSHPEICSPETSILVRKWWDDKDKKHKESWVLINRIGLIKRGEVLKLNPSRSIENEYKNQITEKFNSIYSSNLIFKIEKLIQENSKLSEENKHLKQENDTNKKQNIELEKDKILAHEFIDTIFKHHDEESINEFKEMWNKHIKAMNEKAKMGVLK
ncbi:MAG: hypothetical protein LBB39_01375 [Mycoplasmataceae bacterium]|nr:hypothetical protein [Mycoplasmataceae bacterium]